MLSRIRASLAAKIALLVAGLCLVVFTALAWKSNTSQRDSMFDLLKHAVDMQAQLLYQSIAKPMIVGDDESTKEEFASLGEQFPLTALYMTDFNGNITYSTDETQVRQDFTAVVSAPEIQAMLARGLKEPIREGKYVKTEEANLFVEAVTVKNEKSCYHCHGASEPILGCMLILQNIDKEVASIDDQAVNSAIYSTIGAVVLVAILLLFIRAAVLRPIMQLGQASDAVAAGDYSKSFALPGTDELANLSKNLDGMVKEIKVRLGFAQGILKGVTYPCILVDPDNKITHINQELVTLFQNPKSPEELLGTDASVFFYNDPARPTIPYTACKENRPIAMERTYDIPSGKVTNNVSASPIADLDGNMLGGFSLYFDLTAIREQEAKIAAQNQQMQEIATQARNIVDRLAASSEELSSQVEETTQGAETQRNRTKQTAAAMEEMNATVLEVANNAANAAGVADDMRREAQEGEQVVDATVQAISSVADETTTLQRTMDHLDKQAEGIGAILQVIQDIADQTNLLALNAAIEAARAGEAGRGFAVVADEVRKLAEKTMTATKDVAQSVSSIQSGVQENTQAVQNAATSVDHATEQARHSGEALAKIVTLVGDATDQVRNIAAASEQQSAASEEITKAVESIHHIADENSLAMEEANKALAILAGLASDLEVLIQQLGES